MQKTIIIPQAQENDDIKAILADTLSLVVKADSHIADLKSQIPPASRLTDHRDETAIKGRPM